MPGLRGGGLPHLRAVPGPAEGRRGDQGGVQGGDQGAQGEGECKKKKKQFLASQSSIHLVVSGNRERVVSVTFPAGLRRVSPVQRGGVRLPEELPGGRGKDLGGRGVVGPPVQGLLMRGEFIAQFGTWTEIVGSYLQSWVVKKLQYTHYCSESSLI